MSQMAWMMLGNFRDDGAPHYAVVIARLDRATQYSPKLVVKRSG
jgi:hypothetical protein